MKWNFPTNQEKKIGLLVSLVSIFSISSILKKKLRWPACVGHILLHSGNLPRATKNGLAGQYFGHPCSSRTRDEELER